MLDVLILYVLKRYDCTMYRINKIINETFFISAKPSFGSINPAIARLENSGCVACNDTLTQGGKRSKIISITPTGEKYLKNSLLAFEFSNPSLFLSNLNVALFCIDVFSGDELLNFKDNISCQIQIYKNYIENNLNKPYSSFSEAQKFVARQAIDYITKLEALCR